MSNLNFEDMFKAGPVVDNVSSLITNFVSEEGNTIGVWLLPLAMMR